MFRLKRLLNALTFFVLFTVISHGYSHLTGEELFDPESIPSFSSFVSGDFLKDDIESVGQSFFNHDKPASDNSGIDPSSVQYYISNVLDFFSENVKPLYEEHFGDFNIANIDSPIEPSQ